MKKTDVSQLIVVCVIVLLCVSVGGHVLAAENRSRGFSSGASAGLARFSDGDLGTGLSGRGFIEFAPYIHEIALRLSGGYFHFSDEVTLGHGAFSSTEDVLFENFYVTGGVVYRFSRGSIVPFVTANVGLYHYREDDVKPAPGPIIDGVRVSPFDTVNERDGNDLGVNVGGGVEFFLSENMSVGVELLLHSIQGDVDSEIFDCTAMFRFFPQK